ncbi:redoxin family protein [Tundrisphaera lichenicola]|uniref:TlpA disulfide reductase family protein n=1 Tax=Tundrisphaera lichenicola TaxID=2029860 RepID=UPI003EBCCEA0
MKSRLVCLALGFLCLASWQASAQTLSVGDDAPALAVSEWAKGDKIDRLDADRTYVVEFWATWCGPCRTSIPHLTELQKKYKDKGIQFIGVSVWEQDPSLVAPFVKEMGDKMDYSVALDDVPEGEKGSKGKMAESWMTASDSNGIPTAFIVLKGKVAWIGHPMEMDAPLAKVASGDYDLAKAASDYREEKAKEKKLMAVYTKLQKLGRTASPKEQLKVVDDAIAEDPAVESSLGLQKFALLRAAGDESASTYGEKLVQDLCKDQSGTLNQIAWMIVDPDSEEKSGEKDLAVALKAAIRANELTHDENGAILDTLALAYFKNGEASKALEAQEKAIKILGEDDKGMVSRLEEYRKAVKDKNP